MKRLISFILCIALLMSIFSGCAKTSPSEASVSEVTTAVTVAPTSSPEETKEIAGLPAPTILEETLPAFSGLSDPVLLTYVEDDIYSTLEYQLASDDYDIEEVAAIYISQEYIDELSYNSQNNIFFGYKLSDLDAQFNGDRYVFTLGDDGLTTVQTMEILQDDTYNRILKNIAIGAGVILLCVTVSVVSAGLDAPAIVTMVFAAAAKTGATFALSGACLSAASKAIVTGYQTGDIHKAMKAAALGGSEGFKWGAIMGVIHGGVGKAIHPQQTIGTIPSPAESEQRAMEKYHASQNQITFLNGQQVRWGTPGGTRPDCIVNNNGVLEAIEVKRYDLASSSNVSNLCGTLKRQVADRLLNLPAGSTQRIVLDVKGRNFSEAVIDSAISRIRLALKNIAPDIIIDIMR